MKQRPECDLRRRPFQGICEYQIDDGAANSSVSERLKAQIREKIKTTCGAIPQVVNFLITLPKRTKK